MGNAKKDNVGIVKGVDPYVKQRTKHKANATRKHQQGTMLHLRAMASNAFRKLKLKFHLANLMKLVCRQGWDNKKLSAQEDKISITSAMWLRLAVEESMGSTGSLTD